MPGERKANMNIKELYRRHPLKNPFDIRILTLEPAQAAGSGKASSRSRHSIRRIQCSLEVVSLDENPDYEALSYTWGAPVHDPLSRYDVRPWAAVEQCQLTMTRNLHDALQQLRYEHSKRRLWVDALCINQKDRRERSRQVAIMARIYSGAKGVIAWLGLNNPDHDVACVFALLRYMSSRESQVAVFVKKKSGDFSSRDDYEDDDDDDDVDDENWESEDDEETSIENENPTDISGALNALQGAIERSGSEPRILPDGPATISSPPATEIPEDDNDEDWTTEGDDNESSDENDDENSEDDGITKEDILEALDVRQMLAELCELEPSIVPEDTAAVISQLAPFFDSLVPATWDFGQRRYFYRRWVIQELFHGQNVTLQCGDKQLSLKTAVSGLGALLGIASHGEKIGLDRMFQLSVYFFYISHIKEIYDSGSGNFLELLLRFQENGCHDPKDRIFALQSLLPEPWVPIDYAVSIEELNRQLSRQCVERGHTFMLLKLLGCAEPEHFGLKLPSWILDCRRKISNAVRMGLGAKDQDFTEGAYVDSDDGLHCSLPYHGTVDAVLQVPREKDSGAYRIRSGNRIIQDRYETHDKLNCGDEIFTLGIMGLFDTMLYLRPRPGPGDQKRFTIVGDGSFMRRHLPKIFPDSDDDDDDDPEIPLGPRVAVHIV